MNLLMGEYITMPNHWHRIITIGENEYNRSRDAMHCVSADEPRPSTKITNNPNIPKNKFGPQSKNLSTVIRGFKIAITTNARLILPEFGWQFRFHNHIIRNQKSFNNISNYIINNPKNWKDDKIFSGIMYGVVSMTDVSSC